VSTNLTEQISRRFPGHSIRDFNKNPGHCATESTTFNGACDDELQQKHDIHFIQHGAVAKTKNIATSFLNKWSGTQFYDRKPSYTKISRRTIKFKEISRISRSCRHSGW